MRSRPNLFQSTFRTPHEGGLPGVLSIVFYMNSVPFTEAVLLKQSSLGGSESACRVLAEALAARGHDVHIYATQLLPGMAGERRGPFLAQLKDRTGVNWRPFEDLPSTLAFWRPDVFVSLRMADVFALNIPAKIRLLWNQDLLVDPRVMGMLHAVDEVVFVSEYHKKQWCDIQKMLEPMSWVTMNPIDPSDLVVTETDEHIEAPVTTLPKVPGRFIHVSRPERGLDGLLALWPKVRERMPTATLRICRYSSMYDAAGWGQVCASYDDKVKYANAKYGGIEFIGELNKPQLYAEIAQAVAMVYPTTQANFAETNCIACTEAQACGTPFIGSLRGALPETLAPGAGILIDGDVLTDEHVQETWLAAMAYMLDSVPDQTATDSINGAEVTPYIANNGDNLGTYASMRRAGLAAAMHVTGDDAALYWETHLYRFFEQRYQANKPAVLRQLLHWDNHAAGKLVARDLVIDAEQAGRIVEGSFTEDQPEDIRWALENERLCGRVIRQEEQTAEHYAQFAVQDPSAEAEANQRLHMAAEILLDALEGSKVETPTVLDVACGNGSMALCLLRAAKCDVQIVGYDYSAGVLELAAAAVVAEAFTGRAQFRRGTWETLEGQYDAVFCGEFLEHVEKPWELIDRLESHCKPGGRVVLTTPCGPFAELLEPGIPRHRGHVHGFSYEDITRLGSTKKHFTWSYYGIGTSVRGTSVGYWVLTFEASGAPPALALDYAHAILTERPYQRVVASMIMRNEFGWLHKCLTTIRRIVDRVVIYDTGSVDGSIELAERLGAEVIRGDWPNDFSEARNRALAAVEKDAEWVFWLDCDEQLDGGPRLRHYTCDRGPYRGYVIRQKHLMIDAPNFDDVPTRLFRTGLGIRFYGSVHEQPETVRNEGIMPALDQRDLNLIHLGYHTRDVRRQKLLQRNLPLLMRDIKGGNCRELDYVLYMRDLVNTALFDLEDKTESMTLTAYKHCQQAIRVYDAHFTDPDHRCHKTAWPYYQQALKLIREGYEINWGFLANRGSLDGRRAPGQNLQVRTAAEGDRIISHQLKGWFKQMGGTVIDVAPVMPQRLARVLTLV